MLSQQLDRPSNRNEYAESSGKPLRNAVAPNPICVPQRKTVMPLRWQSEVECDRVGESPTASANVTKTPAKFYLRQAATQSITDPLAERS